MAKQLTANQILGEIGENAVRGRFLTMGFQFDGRSRLEAGIDGIAEIMDKGQPMARMIAVQVKSTDNGRYVSETDEGFTYLLRRQDLEYWRGSNLPVIVVFYRRSDNSFYWKEVVRDSEQAERRLQIDKLADVLDASSVNRLAALTVPKAGFGYYVPALGGGEEALVNMLPIALPTELFIASTPYDGRKAAAILLDGDEPARFDWIIRGGIFWSLHDPRTSCCRDIVELDQVEAIDTAELAFHDDVDEQNKFIHLLREALRHQTRQDLNWSKGKGILYFRALAADTVRNYAYEASKKKADTDVVNVTMSDKDETRVSFVRHHAFSPRFELMGDQWYLIITPTYHFTTNGFTPHPHPAGLLAGKKRLDKSAALRGQVIMWHRFLTEADRAEERAAGGLFGTTVEAEPRLRFGEPPCVQLETRVPEDGWGGGGKKKAEPSEEPEGLFA
ncbi:DUF4365 domain-containing protein [Sphingomonas koreensis]|jgi:hypothetical protein|uniref:DUF4365 domain-containing protein n=2 Tax=Pseudomonadota TaxID=1224 RepID=UPI00234F3C0C|nr:DUF4365 domain-containing protein [Sphingomonas koreensis]MDC7812957.1 DUF4365 domain-containing protein [Sphingomonas koreensis]